MTKSERSAKVDGRTVTVLKSQSGWSLAKVDCPQGMKVRSWSKRDEVDGPKECFGGQREMKVDGPKRHSVGNGHD